MNSFNIEIHAENDLHEIRAFKSFFLCHKSINMINEYRTMCSQSNNKLYIEEGNLKVHGSSIQWPCTIVLGFDRETIQAAHIFKQTNIHSVYCRLISFTCPLYKQQQKLFDVFEEEELIARRDLTIIEHKLFKIFDSRKKIEQPQFVSSFTDFIDNINTKFHFDKWTHLIDYNEFYLAGGSVVTCCLTNAQVFDGQDCDFFYKGNNKTNFLKSVKIIQSKLMQCYFVQRTNQARSRIVNLVIRINTNVDSLFEKEKQVKLQFVYIHGNCSPSSVLTSFDMDLPQFIFNGVKVLATSAAIESIRTRTIIHYGLTRDHMDFPRIAIRINKYLKRGFKLLVPHAFSTSEFLHCSLHIGNHTQ
ncbi:unnamed protein product [Rotaria sp. Silwood2]|nr:unnamed protein product [Rotaria sp. Silwood2]CAF4302532.1 unnamed protein product [Rotaria sp. Silwood2]